MSGKQSQLRMLVLSTAQPVTKVMRWVFRAMMLTATGCAVGPDYHPPAAQVPDRWHESATQGLGQGTAALQQWWEVFGDPELSSLIDRAAEGNLDLRLAVLRIREARALRGIAAGELLPALGGSGSYLRSKSSANGPMAIPQAPGKAETFANTVGRGIAGTAIGTGLATIAPGATGITNSIASGVVGLLPTPSKLPETDEVDLLATGFDASWEIDVFGGIRRNVESADADLMATVEDYRDVLVTLLAEVATTYIDIRALQGQIEATRSNIELQKEAVALTQARLDLELASELDVRQAETNLATTESELPLLEAGLAVAIYRMGVLLGREPSALHGELWVKRPIPQPPAETLVGVPADILRRRPDIRAAERRLAAQTARIGVAAANLYPRFTLSGTFGFEATDFNHMLDRRSITYGFGPEVRWNIFDGLRNLNRIAAQEAARRAAHIAETRYQDGLTDFDSVLVAQRSLVLLENSLAQSRGQVAVNLVSLYKALGGGWSPETVVQSEYLEDRSGALADPAEFFRSGGDETLPWNHNHEVSHAEK